MALPEFVEPMLATLIDQPFDSEQHLFEIKWDGIRALSFVEDGGYRVLSRNKLDLEPRYPELACLESLPSGTVLDGEFIDDSRRLVGDTLAWERDGVLYRIEGAITLERALEIAASMR